MKEPSIGAPASRPAETVRYDTAGEARVVSRAPWRERFSWALYDFANTIFSMNILTLYFTAWMVVDLGSSNTLYALTNGVASLLVFLSIPLLGAISDARRRRKRWVVGFTVAACVACAGIGILGQTTIPVMGEQVAGASAFPGWQAGIMELRWVLLAFIVANFAYQAAQPFYNAMMPELVPAEEQGRMSGFGVALGYVGSIVGVLLVVPFFTGGLPIVGPVASGVMETLRTIPFTEQGGRVSTFVPTAILFLLFSLPLILFCRDHDPAPTSSRVAWVGAFRQVVHTLRDARKHPGALRFILTTFIYQDAVGTIVGFMTLYAVKAVGFEKGAETSVFVALTVPAIVGSYFYGWLADQRGPKTALSATLGTWIVLLVAMVALPGKTMFWIVGIAIGLNFGGVNAAERPVLLSLIPDVEAGRYFSLLLLSARAAAVVGPIVWGLTVDNLETRLGVGVAYRIAVLTIAAMFAWAWFLLRKVPDRRPGTPVVSAA